MMTSLNLLQRHWVTASDMEIADSLSFARISLKAFSRVTNRSGSLLQNWVKNRAVVEYDHYPPNDVMDVRSGSQFFYHCHRSPETEHGHVHLFWHATASGKRRYFAGNRPQWSRTAPSHLFAISLDDRGLPVALFTVNLWVTDGHWFDAETTLKMVDRFKLDDVSGHVDSCAWITNFVRMYRPVISELLSRRDQRMARYKDFDRALKNRRLEVTSLINIDWASDLDALEAEALRRKA